jgi:hypothetical protein
MLSFIDRKLNIIKQVHNEFIGGLDVIMIGVFYRAPPIRDSWIFKPITKKKLLLHQIIG